MATTSVDRPIAATGPDSAARRVASTDGRRATQVSGPEFGRRILILVFGLIQAVIGLRIVLLLVDVRGPNHLVSGVLDLSQTLVGPFEALLRADALHATGAYLDLAGILALIGWTILEVVVLRAIRTLGREPA
jgi:hypothetical protein